MALHLDRQHFHLRPEGVLYLVQLEGVAKNLFLFIIAHILDKNMEFRWSAMEKTDFQDWCVIVGVHKPKENTIVDAKKLLVEKKRDHEP
ncbi:hypothetical protein [Algoriphagus boritolerans]|uniref:hypothetical protein n=1 Tax=Algoriphagus boritolerans TaxID=308111 RepID=UPI000AA55F03